MNARDVVLKMEGSYHGHHDSVMVSVLPDVDEDLGPDDSPIGITDNSGIPDAITGLTTIVPFNDLAAVEAALTRYPGAVAGMILTNFAVAMLMSGRSKVNEHIDTIVGKEPKHGRQSDLILRLPLRIAGQFPCLGQEFDERGSDQNACGKPHDQIQLAPPA